MTAGPALVAGGGAAAMKGAQAACADGDCGTEARSVAKGVPDLARKVEVALPRAKYLITVKDKAPGFEQMGYSLDKLGVLRDTLSALGHKVDLSTADAITEYGTKFRQAFEIVGPNGTLGRITTVWQVDHGTDLLRFITAWPEVFK